MSETTIPISQLMQHHLRVTLGMKLYGDFLEQVHVGSFDRRAHALSIELGVFFLRCPQQVIPGQQSTPRDRPRRK